MKNIDLDKLIGLFIFNQNDPLLFTCGLFLFLFLFFLLGYQFLYNNKRLRVAYVALFSLYLYYKASGTGLLILTLSIIGNYLLGFIIGRSQKKVIRQIFLIAGLITNFSCLAWFKYTNFFIGSINDIFSLSVDSIDIILPLGISFYTFQAVAYLIDVYRLDSIVVKSILEFCFFMSFFPKLLVGPLVKAKDFIPQIRQVVRINQEIMGRGLFLIISGLVKKMIIADYIGINFVSRVFEDPTRYSGIENLMATYGYGLQIYCDFSGYTDIAIGIALLLGCTLPRNFDSPYQSVNITEFWRRWHITLSRWFRDYLYIPLGGNRHGITRQCLYIAITMLLCGFWHGASWNFIFWGFLHGLGLVIHKIYQDKFSRASEGRFVRLTALLITFHFVSLGWIFFRAENFQIAFDVLKQIFFSFHASLLPSLIVGYEGVFIIMAAGYILHFLPQHMEEWGQKTMARMPITAQSLILAATIWLILQVRSAEVQPFIYLQF